MIRDKHGMQIHGAVIEWTPEIMALIPDDVMFAERQRRRGRQRQSYTGGIYWKEHNPDVPQCRCKKCMERREKARKKLLPLKADAPAPRGKA